MWATLATRPRQGPCVLAMPLTRGARIAGPLPRIVVRARGLPSMFRHDSSRLHLFAAVHRLRSPLPSSTADPSGDI